jgi:Sulfotransferase family
MIISLNRRYVFVHIHKCAGTSIEVALAKSLRHNDLVLGSTKSGEKYQDFFKRTIGLNKHSTAQEARQFLGDGLYSRFFKFGFVRHPVDRLHSLYSYALKLAHDAELSDEERAHHQATGKWPDRPPFRYKAVAAALESRSFSDFALHPLTWADAGAQPQWQSLCDAQGELIVDFVGKVETIEQDFATVCERLEVSVPLEVRNTSTEKKSALELSSLALTTVRERFARDFELFGYTSQA